MLLDIGSVFGGIGLAVVGFVVVILVCVVILRLLAAILPSYEDRTPASGTEETPDPVAAEGADPDAAPARTLPGEEQVAAARESEPD